MRGFFAKAALPLVFSFIAGGAAAASAPPEKGKDASIAFADHGGIRDWEADKDVGIWVQDVHRHWYYARFMSPCHELRFVEGVGFVTGPGGQLDRFGAVRTRGGERCVFASFEESKSPPPNRKPRKPAPAVVKDPAAAPAPGPAAGEPKPSG